ncbi:YqjF family protein [Tunicatimonas pelagia]|uniref:YqjF family protein n=1 Tax=Tunicatimonas pelagia TaxID=931531 RepID=UPI0026656188|nr:DUF2071 domain-containing protein [Tunicatimonas pelagia]WKN45937.1 DUF2071 domain-containing protein [Tunicatimonas pelagia]
MKSGSPKSAFLTARWKYLLMANYAVDPSVLKPYVPQATELDYFQGKTYVSIVGFRFLDTKLLGIPVPFHRNFTEVNLRFYVRYRSQQGWRRGTSFISEIVPKPAIAWVANLVYREHYTYAPTQYWIDHQKDELSVEYTWKKGGTRNFIMATAQPTTKPLAPNSIEEFIAQHYWGYNAYSKKTTLEYGVEHPAWSYFPVTDFEAHYHTKALYGSAFVPYLERKPDSVFIADGSNVVVRQGGKIKVK